MNISWYENTTGTWVLQQTNSSVSNGTYYWHFTNASQYSTTYYWKVEVDDGNHTITKIYHFTTREIVGEGWQWVRQLNISNATANYQIKLRLYEDNPSKDDPANGTIDLAGHCKNFPNDIRFGTTNDPTTASQLPQWIEKYNEGNSGGNPNGISFSEEIFGGASQGIAMGQDYFYGISGDFIAVTKISNHYSVQKAFMYDNSSNTYIDYTSAINNYTANDVNLLPSTPTVGDAFFFGADFKFRALRIEIGTAGSGITITWKYWNGSSWMNLQNVVDNTNSFTASGGNYVYYDLPTDWQQNSVSGIIKNRRTNHPDGRHLGDRYIGICNTTLLPQSVSSLGL